MPEPSREGVGLTPPTLTTASAGCGSSGSRTYSSAGVASSQIPDDDDDQRTPSHRESGDPRVRALGPSSDRNAYSRVGSR